jgi:probable phosphoglycerate mutase
METTFLLIRHGLCDHVGKRLAGRASGVHLSPEGREQAQLLAQRLTEGPRAEPRAPTAIYSSPLERARETAEPLAQALGLPVVTRNAFIEIDYGEWTGREIQDLDPEPRWRKYNHFRSGHRIPGGEMTIEIQARVASELMRLRTDHPGQTVAIFSHGDIIRAALTYALGMPIDHFLRLEVAPASVSTLRVGEWGPVLLGLGS